MSEAIKFDFIIRKMAAEQGVLPERIKRSMEAVIEAGWNNPDPAIQATWSTVPHKGNVPTVDEVLTYLAAKAMK